MLDALEKGLPRPGDVLAERYELIKKVGQGGTAAVYKARDQQNGEIVAIKFLMIPEQALERERKQRLRRFLNEAETMSLLQHPQIVSVYAIFEDPSCNFLVLEYFEAQDLKSYIDSHQPPEIEILSYLIQIAKALAYAHQQGVIHRDIKPENVLIANGQAKLLDFGIAKADADDSQQVTTDGTLLGTVAYMSPEQLHSSRLTTYQSDIYSFGALMYESLTRQLPFYADNIGAVVMHIFSKAPVPPIHLMPEIGADLNQLILCCLQKRPAHRFFSAAQLAELLEHVFKQAQSTGQLDHQQIKPLPRIRYFKDFRLLEALRTLLHNQVTGCCQVWTSWQDLTIYLQAGQIVQLEATHPTADPKSLLYDACCWSAGGFYFMPGAFELTSPLSWAQETENVLDAAALYLQDYQSLWSEYQDNDLPEVIMPPSELEQLALSETLLTYINGQRRVNQICAHLQRDRLNILQSLKALEDRQHIFVERERP